MGPRRGWTGLLAGMNDLGPVEEALQRDLLHGGRDVPGREMRLHAAGGPEDVERGHQDRAFLAWHPGGEIVPPVIMPLVVSMRGRKRNWSGTSGGLAVPVVSSVCSPLASRRAPVTRDARWWTEAKATISRRFQDPDIEFDEVPWQQLCS